MPHEVVRKIPEEVGIHFNAIDDTEDLAFYDAKHVFPYGTIYFAETDPSICRWFGCIWHVVGGWLEPDFE